MISHLEPLYLLVPHIFLILVLLTKPQNVMAPVNITINSNKMLHILVKQSKG